MRGIPLVNPPSFTPTRDRTVRPRSVECPACEAMVDSPCQSLEGRELPTCHPTRRRMAVRADNLARGL